MTVYMTLTDSVYECEQDEYCKCLHYSLSCKTDYVSVSLQKDTFSKTAHLSNSVRTHCFIIANHSLNQNHYRLSINMTFWPSQRRLAKTNETSLTEWPRNHWCQLSFRAKSPSGSLDSLLKMNTCVCACEKETADLGPPKTAFWHQIFVISLHWDPQGSYKEGI